MKNLLTYLNPSKNFDHEVQTTVKIQIDNSLDLGWKRQDILLITNFEYEHHGVKSLVIGDDNFCQFWPPTSKINAILDLFKKDLIKENEIYWYHGFAEYQLHPIAESEIDLENTDLFLPDFGRLPRWSSGSIFFKHTAKDIFEAIRELCYHYQTDEEAALDILTGHGAFVDWERKVWVDGQKTNFNSRINKANITYNFHSGNIRSNYPNALKPIRVARFHLKEVDFFLHGQNKLGLQIVPVRLVKIFNHYGIQ